MIQNNYETLLQKISDYTHQQLANVSKEYDSTEKFPQVLLEDFLEMDIFRLLLDEEDELSESLHAFMEIIRIVSHEFAAMASILLTQGTYAIWPLQRYGTKRQKDAYLEKLVSGELLGAFALHEAQDEGNLDLMQSTAIETETGWRINAEKETVSNSPVAGLFFVVAKARKINGDEGIGIFIVEANQAGVTVGEASEKMGIRALPVAPIYLNNVEVNKDAVLGGLLAGKEQVETIFTKMKIAIAMQAIGLAEGALDKGLHYASLERNFGKRLIDIDNTQSALAEVKSKAFATSTMLRYVLQHHMDDPIQAAMAKLVASENAIEVTETIIQVTGGYGYMRNNDIERFARDAKVTAIYGGSSHSQKKLIAKPWLTKR